MPTPAQSKKAMDNMAALYGSPSAPQRLHKRADPPAVMDMLRDGSAALAGRVSCWGPMPPESADLDAARRQVEGLRRLLGELSGGPADGAA